MNYLYVRGTKAGTKQKHVCFFFGFQHFDVLAKGASTRQVQKLVLCDPYLWVRYQNNQVKKWRQRAIIRVLQSTKNLNFNLQIKNKRPKKKIRFMLTEIPEHARYQCLNKNADTLISVLIWWQAFTALPCESLCPVSAGFRYASSCRSPVICCHAA